jgi:asparagine synthase (glutamine-hydrolysing)
MQMEVQVFPAPSPLGFPFHPLRRQISTLTERNRIFCMPGLVGFVSNNRETSRKPPIDAMLKSMLHEPTYISGSLAMEGLGLSAAWACHEGSFSDCLPIWNETRDVCLLFVGEDFANDAQLDNLRLRGHKFDSDKGGYLVHLYEELNESFFVQLNGIFSGLLIDLRQNKVVVFNDRYGLGRVYYHEASDGFYFASEAKAILKALPHLRQIDDKGLGEYFACGAVLQNRTLFPDIKQLPSGSAWTFTPGQDVRKKSYFDPKTWESQTTLSEEDYYEKLKSTFERILPSYLRDQNGLSMSMTGGLDSRIIMAWARSSPTKLACYSHRGIFNECADARIARRVAKVCGQTHRVIRVDEDFLSQFPTLATKAVYVTDGTMDVSGAVGLYVNRIAKTEIAPVRMTGNYGGEILRGLIAISPAKLRNPYLGPDFMRLVREGIDTLAAEKHAPRTSFVAFKQVPWHHYSRFALESSQLPVRSPYLDNELVSLAYRSPTQLGVNQRLAARLIADGNPALAEFPTDRGPLGRPGRLGRIAELYQEFTFKADYAYDYGMPQWMVNLDRMLGPLHLERLFLGRHKYYHFRYWYRTRLASFVKEILLDPRALARPYLEKKAVEKMVSAHTAGRGNYTSEIHSLLSAELMQQQLID